MTEAERIAHSHQAKSAWEIVQPILDTMDVEYTRRIVEVANSELSRDKRADKITALSNALKIADNLRQGLQAMILDGDVAQRDKLKADRIDQMTKPQKRLLGIAPY